MGDQGSTQEKKGGGKYWQAWPKERGLKPKNSKRGKKISDGAVE